MAQASISSVRESELQKLLADERARTEQHKLNYQTIKAEHQRLYEENVTLTEQVSRLTDETRQHRDYDKKSFLQTERELAHTRALLAELKSQVMTPGKVELLRAQHEEEFEQHFSEVLTRAEAEADKYRQEFNKMRYEYGFIKAEFEHDRLESERRLEETKLKYESEITRLKRENESATARKSNNRSENLNATKLLQKENLQLSQQVQGLKEEINEIRSQQDQSDNQTSDIQRQHIRQIAEFSSRQQSYESEISKLTEQCKRWQQNATLQTEKSSELQSKLVESNQESKRLQQRLEDSERNSRQKLVNYKEESSKEKANFKKEMSFLEQQMKALRYELEEVQKVNEKHARMLIEKEKETARRLQMIRLEESQKADKIEADRVELEIKYQAIQTQLGDAEDRNREEVRRFEDKIRAILESKIVADKEVLVSRTKLEHYQKQVAAAAVQEAENGELRQQLAKLRTNLQVTDEAGERLIERNKDLNAALEAARKEIELFRNQDERRFSENELNAQREEIRWEREKVELEKHASQLERQIKSLRSETASARKSYQRKISKYSTLITKLRNRLELNTAKIEELNIEKEALKKSIPTGDPNTVKRQLRDLQHRHEEFRKLLQTHHLFGGEASSVFPLNSLASVWMFASDQQPQPPPQHYGSLHSIQDRLKRLDEAQSSQMQNLVELKMGKLQ